VRHFRELEGNSKKKVNTRSVGGEVLREKIAQLIARRGEKKGGTRDPDEKRE